MNPDELLLRDIHLPDPVSWWPPAMGWWMIIVAVFGLIVAVAWWRRRQSTIRNAPATIARCELDRLRKTWTEHGDTQRLVNEISIWLRRAGMSMTSRRQAASPTGDQWRQCLDEIAGEPIFADTNDRLVTEIPYRAPAPEHALVDGDQLLALCDRWLDAATRKARQA